jgi:hypothetical protein
LAETFLTVIDTYTAGDPMQEGVHWTNLTRCEIVDGLAKEGIEVSVTVVDRLLEEFDFRSRKPQKVKTMGKVPDRNAQFEKIARLKAKYRKVGRPVLSMDTKKRERLGDYARGGRLLSTAALRAWDHDFPRHSPGVVIPHGLYDEALNEGYVHLGSSHDTSEFAADALLDGWRSYGWRRYPGATDLLLLCDSGGSNSCRRLVFKEQLQDVADWTGLAIRVAHYPTHCSKYNPIEHRLFPHLTRVCQGMFLQSVDMVRDLMRKASTATGLRVFVKILNGLYETGVGASEEFVSNMRIRFDRFLPQWNYVVTPTC